MKREAGAQSGEGAGSPAGTVRVRPARSADWPSVQALLSDVVTLHAEIAPGYFRAAQQSAAEWRLLLDDVAATILIAESFPQSPAPTAARVAGVVVVKIYDTPESPMMVPRRRGHVETLVVDRAARRQGIGRRLMAEAGHWARVRGAVEMVLTTWTGNSDADAFYERLGYRVLSRVLSAAL